MACLRSCASSSDTPSSHRWSFCARSSGRAVPAKASISRIRAVPAFRRSVRYFFIRMLFLIGGFRAYKCRQNPRDCHPAGAGICSSQLSCRAAPMFVRRYVCAQNSCNNCNDCNGEGDDGGLLWHLLNAALQGKSVWILDCLFGKVYFCSGNSLMELKQSHEWT